MKQWNTEIDLWISRLEYYLKQDERIAGFSLDGSFGTAAFDEFSDLDVVIAVYPEYIESVLPTRHDVLGQLGTLLSVHQQEHERQLLICLYDIPPHLLHVDVIWVSLPQYERHIKTPKVIWERNSELSQAIAQRTYQIPATNVQTIENMIWAWLHNVLGKLCRGELLEAMDYLAEIRLYGFSPLLQLKNGRQLRRHRRVESLPPDDYALLRATFCTCDKEDCLRAIKALMLGYISLRNSLQIPDFKPNTAAEIACLRYLSYVEHGLRGF